MIIVSVFIIIIDQFTKYIIQNTLPAGASVPFLGKICYLTYVTNRGVAFGIFSGFSKFFPFLSFIVIIALAVLILRRRSDLTSLAFSLVLGGAAGNLIDRLRFGFVIDFIDFRVWPVFNLADTAITIGVAILCIQSLFNLDR